MYYDDEMRSDVYHELQGFSSVLLIFWSPCYFASSSSALILFLGTIIAHYVIILLWVLGKIGNRLFIIFICILSSGKTKEGLLPTQIMANRPGLVVTVFWLQIWDSSLDILKISLVPQRPML